LRYAAATKVRHRACARCRDDPERLHLAPVVFVIEFVSLFFALQRRDRAWATLIIATEGQLGRAKEAVGIHAGVSDANP
jgi:hypothetical protein